MEALTVLPMAIFVLLALLIMAAVSIRFMYKITLSLRDKHVVMIDRLNTACDLVNQYIKDQDESKRTSGAK